jgi:hypothetical protein
MLLSANAQSLTNPREKWHGAKKRDAFGIAMHAFWTEMKGCSHPRSPGTKRLTRKRRSWPNKHICHKKQSDAASQASRNTKNHEEAARWLAETAPTTSVSIKQGMALENPIEI